LPSLDSGKLRKEVYETFKISLRHYLIGLNVARKQAMLRSQNDRK